MATKIERLFSRLLVFSIVHFSAADSFGTLHNLTVQNCSAASLNTIPNIQAIKELSLEFCDAKNPVAGNFSHFSALTVLEIKDSLLENWNNSTLNDLKYLRVLSLPGNNIKSLKNWTKQALPSLNRLELQRNEFQSICRSDFEYFPNLQFLDLSQNLVESIGNSSLSKLLNLKFLNLSYNGLEYINEMNFFRLEHLVQLDLSNNKITNISGNSFETNSILHTLNLSANELKNLTFLKVKSLLRLLNLNLSKNAIEELQDNNFESNSELNNLDLSWNFIRTLNKDHFEGLKSLEVLNISHNGLLNLTADSFKPLSSIRELVLTSNNLSSLPTALFSFTPLLEHIDLSENSLGAIEMALFAELHYLTSLKLRGNQLFDIEFVVTLPQPQLTLDLSDNLLKSSTVDMRQLIRFRSLLLAGNPWTCQWLIEEIVKAHSNIHFGRVYDIPKSNWTSEILNFTGINCYDEVHETHVMILSMGCNRAPHHIESPKPGNCHEHHSTPEIPTPPPVVWPKLRADKFDSRSVIIWMLIAIAIAFAALRIAQQFLDKNNPNTYLRMLRPQRSDATEMEVLHSPDDSNSNSTSCPYGKLENSYKPNNSTV